MRQRMCTSQNCAMRQVPGDNVQPVIDSSQRSCRDASFSRVFQHDLGGGDFARCPHNGVECICTLLEFRETSSEGVSHTNRLKTKVQFTLPHQMPPRLLLTAGQNLRQVAAPQFLVLLVMVQAPTHQRPLFLLLQCRCCVPQWLQNIAMREVL